MSDSPSWAPVVPAAPPVVETPAAPTSEAWAPGADVAPAPSEPEPEGGCIAYADESGTWHRIPRNDYKG